MANVLELFAASALLEIAKDFERQAGSSAERGRARFAIDAAERIFAPANENISLAQADACTADLRAIWSAS